MEGVSIALVDTRLSVTFSRGNLNPLLPAEPRFQQLAVNVLTPGSSAAGEVVLEVGATQLLGRDGPHVLSQLRVFPSSHVRSTPRAGPCLRARAHMRRHGSDAGPHECSVLVLAMVSRLGALQGTRCPRLSCGEWDQVLCFQLS